MNTKTIVKLGVGIIVIGGGIGYFMYQAMQSSWAYYYSVDDFSTASSRQGQSFRLAGRVKPGSIARDLENLTLRFTLAGTQAELPVQYKGVTPDNLTENGEVVVEGRLAPTGIFEADTVITRCESKYQAKVK